MHAHCRPKILVREYWCRNTRAVPKTLTKDDGQRPKTEPSHFSLYYPSVQQYYLYVHGEDDDNEARPGSEVKRPVSGATLNTRGTRVV